MTNIERLANLSSYVNNREIKEKNERERKELDMQEKLVILDSYKDSIKDIVDTAKFCFANKINIGQNNTGMNFNPNAKAKNDFMADSWFHFLGIICKHPSYSVYEPIGVGVREGGANGTTDLIVTENGVESYNSDYSHFNYDYKKFVDNFADFETRFYEYLDSLNA